MKTWKILSSSLLIASLAACGGGGGGGAVSSGGNGNPDGENDETTPPEVTYNTGKFIDSPVQGLRYSTPSLSGLTDVDGTFRYNDDEVVTFSLGGVTIGEAVGASVITPFTLYEVKPPNKERIISNALFDNTSVQTLDKALNIASFLQNLDADQDASNGINLGNANEILANSTLDFSKFKAIDFNSKSQIASLREMIGLTSQPIDLESVASHLYTSLGIDIESSAASGTTGSSGLQTKFSSNLEYDDQGRIVLEEIDTNGDGIFDITKTFRYENDLLVETSNSKLGITETLSYDSAKRLIERITRYGDGRISRESYTYSGELLIKFLYDQNDNGQPDRITEYSYNTNDQLIETRIDNDGDGTVDIVTTASYYSDGKQATHSEDKDNDGVPDLIIAYVYDDSGNRKSFNISIDEDAIPSETSLFTYAGNLVTEYFVLDSEYRLKFKESYTYDSEDRRKEVRKDTNGDGKEDIRVQYKYDDNGNRILTAEDHNGDGIADKFWRQSSSNAMLATPWKNILDQR